MAEHSEPLLDDEKLDAVTYALVQLVAIRAVTHLIGSVGGRNVLDLACDEGPLSRRLAVHGASVTGVDTSIDSIELARQMEAHDPHGISYITCDPEDLYVLDDAAFDDVVCNLSLGRIDNLSAVIAEVARVIRLGGRFVFSVVHPCFERQLLESSREVVEADNYYAEGLRDGLGGLIHHRTLATYINAVAARGFTVRRILEPAAEERDVGRGREYERWRRMPVALAVEAIFPHI